MMSMFRGVACFAVAGGALAEVIPPTGAAFVHLFEWSWSDIALECETFLGPKRVTAVQVSPPNDHMAGDEWWTRYQPVTYNLTSRSGNETEFKDMVQRCKKAGVDIYVDAVVNHAAAGSGTSVMGHAYGGRSTPIYAQEDFHHNPGDAGANCAINDYSNKHTVQYCDLEGLPDLCTGCDKVQTLIADYIDSVAALGVTGIRVDAAKHQDADELGGVLRRAKSAPDLFVFHEVISAANEAVRPEMYFGIGSVTEFDYARKLAPNFMSEGKLEYLDTFGEGWGLMPHSKAVVFLDNHDTQRGEAMLTYKNGKLYELANIFMLAHPYGYPKVMSSYAFDGHDQGPPKNQPVHADGRVACHDGPMAGGDKPWVCEHRWTPIANMFAWRATAADAPVENFIKEDGNRVSFCRGRLACIALNRQDSTWTAALRFSVPAGKYCNIIVSDDPASCPLVEVAEDGSAKAEVPGLGAVAVHIGKRVIDTEIIM